MVEDKQIYTLTDRQREVIPQILSSKNVTGGVKQAGICKGTWYNWLKIPEFKNEFKRQKNELINEAFLELKLATVKAVRVLKELLYSDNEVIKLKASTTILEFTLRSNEQEQIIDRLDRLEEMIR